MCVPMTACMRKWSCETGRRDTAGDLYRPCTGDFLHIILKYKHDEWEVPYAFVVSIPTTAEAWHSKL